jgi:RNA polymerase sigma factor (sigma-70 family)
MKPGGRISTMAHTRLGAVLRQIRGAVTAGALAEAPDGELLERFAARGEEGAFAALVRRHGPMVLGVCRRVLGHAQDAEDAFQATFLVLARQAESIRKQASVGGWLHRVAQRLAVKARARRARRHDHERRAGTMRKAEADVSGAWQDLQGVLDEALQSLPEKYRSALVLSYLEGKTHEEARRQLGCPLATLRSWVARGRKLLRTRLARRGLALSAEALATALLAGAAEAAVPAALSCPTVEASVRLAVGRPAGIVSERVIALAEQGLKAVGATRAKIALALLTALGLCAAGAGVTARRAGLPQRPGLPQAAGPKSEPGPDGRPTAKRMEPVRTDRYGDPLPPGAIARMGTVRFRHGSTVTGLAFTTDGKTLISGSYDKTVRLWDVTTGRELRRLPALQGSVIDFCMSRDRKTFAAVDTGTLYLGDVPAGRITLPQPRSRELPTCAALSADGKLLAAGCWDAFGTGAITVRLWDTATGKMLHAIAGHRSKVTRAAFAPDGKSLVTGGEDGALRVWDVAGGKEQLRLNGKQGVLSLAFSGDGRILAAGDAGGQIRLWGMPGAKPLRPLRPQYLGIAALAFSPDNKVFASGGGGRVILWSLATGKQLRMLWGSGEVIAFSPDGRLLAAGGHACAIHLWEVATGKERTPPRPSHPCSIGSVAISRDGTVVATSGQDRTIRLWQTATGKELRRLKADSPWVSPMALSPDGKVLAFDRGILDRATGKVLGHFQGQDYGINALAFSPDSRTLAMATTDVQSGKGRMIRLWDVARVREIKHFGEMPVHSLNYSPDGKTLAAGNGDGTVSLWDVAGGRESRRIPGHRREVRSVAFSPDGRAVASASFDGDLFLWDAATGKQLRQLAGAGGPRVGVNILAVAFAPNGKILATAEQPFTSRSGASITLWEVATGRVRRRLAGHQGDVNSLAFAGDSRTLISGSTDTTALVWNVTALPGVARAGRPSRAEFDAFWADLRSPDVARAFRAVRTLTHSRGTVEYLAGCLPPVPIPDGPRLRVLIEALDSPRFRERHKATQELNKLGPAAGPALRKALQRTPSVEVQGRLRRLLAKLAAEELRTERAVETLELMGTPEAWRLLESLAGGAGEATVTREAKAVLKRRVGR